MKGKIAVTLLVGAGIGFTGCQAPMFGGLPWGRSSGSQSSTAPDVGGQRFSGLSKEFGGDYSRAMGQSQAQVGAIGGPRESNDGFLAASWKKTTAAVSGTFASKPKIATPENDPTRLDNMPKKIGPEVYIAAARLFENQSKFAEAEGKYHEALRAAPSDLNALVGLARLYDRQAQPQKAIEVYQKALQAHPTSALVYNDLGLCYRRQRQLDKSIVALKRAVDLNGENAKYRNNLAGALVEAGRSGEAYEQFALVNSPSVAHYNVACLLQQKGQQAEATQHLQQALAQDPTLAAARDMLAQLGAETEATPATIRSPAVTPIARSSASLVREPVAAYAAGAADQRPYTSAPKTETASTAEAPSFHIGDDAPPAAEVAKRPAWSSTWAVPSAAPGSQPLPPTD
jgi:tetratricopeptide (TPR) repeat protein